MFAEDYLLPFFDKDLQRLGKMVRPVPDFPRPGVNFQHVLNISQQSGGLALCTSLLHTHFTGDWATVDMIVCCEAGGLYLCIRVGLAGQCTLGADPRSRQATPTHRFCPQEYILYIFDMQFKSEQD
jgi:Adenine/guanine phosphoribosyltransferases and related PRPP-binding proteins